MTGAARGLGGEGCAHAAARGAQEEDRAAAARALGALCETEDFRTHEHEHVGTDEVRDAVIALKEPLAEAVKDREVRKAARPFMDFQMKCKRALMRRGK